MNDGSYRASPDGFDESLRRLAARPFAIPAEAAARAVLARLDDAGGRGSLRRIASVAALLALIALGTWLGARHTASMRNLSAGTLATPPLPTNVMVFWIDAHTPVYFVLSPVGSEEGETS